MSTRDAPPPDETERALLAAAERLRERVETCHERVACPKCAAPRGSRCWDLRHRHGPQDAPPPYAKHSHRERIEADGTPLR